MILVITFQFWVHYLTSKRTHTQHVHTYMHTRMYARTHASKYTISKKRCPLPNFINAWSRLSSESLINQFHEYHHSNVIKPKNVENFTFVVIVVKVHTVEEKRRGDWIFEEKEAISNIREIPHMHAWNAVVKYWIYLL